MNVIKYGFYSIIETFLWLNPIYILNAYILRMFGAEIGRNSRFYRVMFLNVEKRGFKGLQVGKNVRVNKGAILDLTGKIYFGDNVTVSSGTMVFSHLQMFARNNTIPEMMNRKRNMNYLTVISNNVYIGANSVVQGGVYIDEEVIIGCNSLVNRSINEKGTYVGSPVRKIK